jgi:hypothetical protein
MKRNMCAGLAVILAAGFASCGNREVNLQQDQTPEQHRVMDIKEQVDQQRGMPNP